jgi:hypothetical protein
MNKRIREKKCKKAIKLATEAFEAWMKINAIMIQTYQIIRMYQELKTEKKLIEGGIILPINSNSIGNNVDEKEAVIPLTKTMIDNIGNSFTIGITK